ncbi:MAG TPA: tRNA (adenosine(37)-N6)-dimethylallyltransferase MiaA [Ohtaekwangia sp.]|nr:tRNA (adenosine(37)-N6)-dimethylallyltransferase MiaA [Ohtaekwangia sp.]
MPDFWKNKKLIVVTGPTAVGKTSVAIALARYFGAEIVSADSRQFFKELNIGTAKPDDTELAAAPHHFINSHSIHDDYDAAQFGNDALKLIHALFDRFDYVVLCGGSGLYIKAVLEGFDEIPAIDSGVRREIMALYEAQGISWLQAQMKENDPEYYATLDQQNPHRLIRALEVKKGTGFSIAAFRKNNILQHPFGVVKIGLELPREVLYQRIDERMDEMIAQGLFNEAENLYPFKDHNALQTVGYKEIFDFLDGAYSKEEAIRLLKRNSRRYAKRQLTWFKRDTETTWFNPGDVNAIVRWIGK